MGHIITDLKETFRRGNIFIQLIYINVSIFIIGTLINVFLQLFQHSIPDIFGIFALPAANREEDILSENGMEWAENRELFSKLNETILHEKLYLSPNLSRDDLVRIVHLNYARFARMIKENTGGNLSGYINNLRLNHAIQLLNEHPNYTMKAIAEDSGFNSMPTFNNLFKKKTGMTPFEFKSAQKE